MPVRRRYRSALIARLTNEGPHRPQAEILAELRRCLLDGEVPPGSTIPLEEVAEVFGVSRIPVREALKTLIGEGLVEHRPNAGYTVASLTPRELHELYLVREALESAALTAAVAEAGPANDDEARAAYLALTEAVANANVPAYHRESRHFHWALVRPCGMLRLLGMLEAAWNVTEPLRPMAQVTPRERLALHVDHEAMLAAFLARDAESLLGVSRAHHHRLQTALGGPA